MSEKDLVKELKAELVEITKDRDDALAKVKSKETRMKQVLIKLEHREQDVHSIGHKIGEQNKEIADLKAKLETKTRLLDEALQRIKDINDDSTQETDTDTDNQELDQ
jgi:seryl-tRNA synthetase